MQQIDQLEFDQISQIAVPIESGSVYFYALSNEGINVRKTVAADFETWITMFNHYGSTSVIITGAAPLVNTERYTLLHHIENFVKLPPPDPTAVTEEPSS